MLPKSQICVQATSVHSTNQNVLLATHISFDQLFSSCFFWEKCQYRCVFGIPKDAQGDFFLKENEYKYVHSLVVIKHG